MSASPGLRVGLFGGSFDPIHCGHILPVDEARRDLGLDRVFYLPTASPPHKPGERYAPALARYCMVEIALLSWPRLWVSDYELRSDGPSYTVETLEHFGREMAGCELFLFLGADSYLELDQWFRWRDLLALAQLVVLERPGYDLTEERERWPGARVWFCHNRPVDLSSTSLRSRLQAGEPIEDQEVPTPVLSYLEKYRLYS